MELADKINEYYSNNKNELHRMFNYNENIIDGRICHSSIIVLNILDKFIDINNYMEIGVHNGGSMTMMLSSNKNKNLYGIDLFEDMYNIEKHLNSEKFNTYSYFKRDNLSQQKTIKNLNIIKNNYNNSSEITMIQGNSYFDNTEEKFSNIINGKLLDVLFIDGDHTFDGVKNDYERYEKYVKKGGFIIFDDYHHEIIKKYVDGLLKNNSNLKLIIKFKSDTTKAIDTILQKL